MTRSPDATARNPDWWDGAKLKRERVRGALLAKVPVNDICRVSGAGPAAVVRVRDDLVREGFLPKRGRGHGAKGTRKSGRVSWIEALKRANSSVDGGSSQIPHTEEVG